MYVIYVNVSLGFAYISLLGSLRGEHFIYVFIVACRFSNVVRTALSTSTATGPATRKDSATCLANSGLVGERLMPNPLKLV